MDKRTARNVSDVASRLTGLEGLRDELLRELGSLAYDRLRGTGETSPDERDVAARLDRIDEARERLLDELMRDPTEGAADDGSATPAAHVAEAEGEPEDAAAGDLPGGQGTAPVPVAEAGAATDAADAQSPAMPAATDTPSVQSDVVLGASDSFSAAMGARSEYGAWDGTPASDLSADIPLGTNAGFGAGTNAGTNAGPGATTNAGISEGTGDADATQPMPRRSFCPRCGREIQPGFKFCIGCGYKL